MNCMANRLTPEQQKKNKAEMLELLKISRERKKQKHNIVMKTESAKEHDGLTTHWVGSMKPNGRQQKTLDEIEKQWHGFEKRTGDSMSMNRMNEFVKYSEHVDVVTGVEPDSFEEMLDRYEQFSKAFPQTHREHTAECGCSTSEVELQMFLTITGMQMN